MSRHFGFFNLIALAASCWFSQGSLTEAVADSGDVTDDIPSLFICSRGAICPGDRLVVWADVDGVNNGTDYDPYEIMVSFFTQTGSACGEILSDGERVYHQTPSDLRCKRFGEYPCGYERNCDRSFVTISFVDVTAAGFDRYNPATWVYKSVRSLQFYMTNGGRSRYNVDHPFHIATAYKTGGDPQRPGGDQLIDGISSCEASSDYRVLCEFEDADEGIKEIWIATDYHRSIIDGFVIHSSALSSEARTEASAPDWRPWWPYPYPPYPYPIDEPWPWLPDVQEPDWYGADSGQPGLLGRYGRWSWPSGRYWGYYHRPRAWWGAPSRFAGRGCGPATGRYCYSAAPQTDFNPWYRRDYGYPRRALPPWAEDER
jgi:hypothetical protein